MGREAEVVVGGEQEVRAPVDHDLGVRRGLDRAEMTAERRGVEACQVAGEHGIERAGGRRHAAVMAPGWWLVNRGSRIG